MPVGRDLTEGEHLADSSLQLLAPIPGLDGDCSTVGDQTLQLWHRGLGGEGRGGEGIRACHSVKNKIHYKLEI